ncbi:hypothetical protein HK096_005032 [Nowakowskiella sp. JEL0078]|nr:hypothetical protein HK096_005032 [Nowakowskiella sp. JEL0078]
MDRLKDGPDELIPTTEYVEKDEHGEEAENAESEGPKAEGDILGVADFDAAFNIEEVADIDILDPDARMHLPKTDINFFLLVKNLHYVPLKPE